MTDREREPDAPPQGTPEPEGGAAGVRSDGADAAPVEAVPGDAPPLADLAAEGGDAETEAPPAPAGDVTLESPAPAEPTDPAASAGALPEATTSDAAPAGAGDALRTDRIRLVGESGHSMSVGVRTPLGKHMVRQFGEDSNAWDTEQCTLERGPDGAWQVNPQPGTTNETLLNGEAVTGARPLREGDVIAVGRAGKGIARLPLTVRGG